MTTLERRRALRERVATLLSIALGAVVCGGGGSDAAPNDSAPTDAATQGTDAGSVDALADGAKVLPQAYVNMAVGPGENGVRQCPLPPGQWLVVGEQYDLKEDGRKQNGAPVRVRCEVRAEGDAFVVSAQLTVEGGLNGGSVAVSGRVQGAGQQLLRLRFSRDDLGAFEQGDCTMDFSRTHGMGVAAGHIWGAITCPKATSIDPSRTCEGTGQLKFENCTQ